jgi:hypothetical protein
MVGEMQFVSSVELEEVLTGEFSYAKKQFVNGEAEISCAEFAVAANAKLSVAYGVRGVGSAMHVASQANM